MKIKHAYIATFFCVISFILLIVLLTRKPEIIIDKSTNIQQNNRLIDSLNRVILANKIKLNDYQRNIDSLKSLPPQIIIKYREKKAALPTATVSQLDSIIRANTGL